MRMVRWMCGVKIKDRFDELRERLGIDYIILVLQQNRLQWYGQLGMCCKRKTDEEMYGV